MADNAQIHFAYLQLYSRFAPFGGVSEVDKLAATLANFNTQGILPLAAALTDTFSLAAFPLWQRLLQEEGLSAIAGAEVGLCWSERGLPFALLLLAESQEGFSNLCRLLTAGLASGDSAPLTASLNLETLARYKKGLIAIAPYYGGPVTAALQQGKNSEGRARAQALREMFGPEHFYIGAPPLAAQPQPQTISEQLDERKLTKEVVRLNAALVKLSRDLGIGLVGTGEARYATPEEARAYTTLRGRLQRALGAQYPPALLQQEKAASAEWLYSPQPNRPVDELHLRTPEELLAHYNEADWPGATTNNRLIAARCLAWQKPGQDYLAQLRERCEAALPGFYPENPPLELLHSELERIGELRLATSLLAAAQLAEKAEAAQVIVPRRLGGSLVARLLKLTEQEPVADFSFEAYTNGRPLRLEVGQAGRTRALHTLNAGGVWRAAPLALPGETGELALLHPRQVLVSLDGPLGEVVALQPARAESGVETGAQAGPLAPEGCARLEISESSNVSRLQLALDLLNRWRSDAGEAALSPADLLLANPEAVLEAGSQERALLLNRLESLRSHYPAAYYAAAMTLAATDNARLAVLSDLARQAGLKVLPPDLPTSEVNFAVEGLAPTTIRAGLISVLDGETARHVVDARQAAPFAGLDDLIKRVPLTALQIERLSWSGALDAFGKRENLAAAAQALEVTGQAWQEYLEATAAEESKAAQQSAADSGAQLSLFDMFAFEAVTPPPPREKPGPVELPEVAPASPLERLRRSFQALGFLTAEHPLWNHQTPTGADTSRENPTPLSQLEDLAGESHPLLVVGLVTAIRRVPVVLSGEQGQGEELIVLRLEDFSGQAELLVPRDTPAEGFELAEGVALAARARAISETEPGNSQAQSHTVLVAVALAPYQPESGVPVFATSPTEEDPELAALLAAVEAEPSGATPAGQVSAETGTPIPHEDENWASSLFESLGIGHNGTPAEPAPQQTPGKGRSNGSKGGAAQRQPQRVRRVHIHFPVTENEDEEWNLMDKLRQVLREFAGEDAVTLYMPQPDGSVLRLEPQSLFVNYNDSFATAVMALLGPDSVRLEERIL
ncbi:MAG TPA: PHP domain-containing protein [Chloroflexia bacterium]|nr:PHP domain-containing protein [Chloroflexia bacterium]